MGWQSIYITQGGSQGSKETPIQLDFLFKCDLHPPGHLLVLFTVQDSQILFIASCEGGVCLTAKKKGVCAGFDCYLYEWD